jgi:hypothetical protein
MSLVPQEAIDEIYRELHRVAYDLYEEKGPVLEDELGYFAEASLPRIMPMLEELARAGEYRQMAKRD